MEKTFGLEEKKCDFLSKVTMGRPSGKSILKPRFMVDKMGVSPPAIVRALLHERWKFLILLAFTHGLWFALIDIGKRIQSSPSKIHQKSASQET